MICRKEHDRDFFCVSRSLTSQRFKILFFIKMSHKPTNRNIFKRIECFRKKSTKSTQDYVSDIDQQDITVHGTATLYKYL